MFDYLRTDDAMLDALCIVAMSRSIVLCIVCIDNTLAIQNSTPMISGAAIAVGYRLRREVDPSESRLNRDACNVIAAKAPQRWASSAPPSSRITDAALEEIAAVYLAKAIRELLASTRSARGSSDADGAHSRARTGACNKADDGLCRAPPCAADFQLPQHRTAAVIVANWHRLLSHWTMMGASWPTNTDYALTSCSPGSFISEREGDANFAAYQRAGQQCLPASG